MEFLSFPARLSSPDGRVGETGRATVSGTDDAVDFTGEFVPLLPLGSVATVEWLLGDTVVQAYTGEVYLSSPDLLRLVGLDGAIVRETRAIFAANTRLPVRVFPSPGAAGLPAEVVYLSRHAVTLHTTGVLEGAHRVLMDCEVDFLTLRGMALAVEHQIALRRGDALMLCRAAGISEENLIALSAYVARLEHLPEKV